MIRAAAMADSATAVIDGKRIVGATTPTAAIGLPVPETIGAATPVTPGSSSSC